LLNSLSDGISREFVAVSDVNPVQIRDFTRRIHSYATEMMKHTVVRNALLLYFVQFSGYIMPMIALPYLARVLTTEKFGLIAFGQTFAWYFVILTEYGFNLTATREIAIRRDTPEQVSLVFSAVMLAKLFLTLIGFVIMATVVAVFPSLRPYWLLFLISFATVIGNMLFPLWLYQGLQKMGSVAVRDFGAKLLSLGALFLFVHSDRDYLIAAAAQSGGFLLAGIIDLVTVPWKLRIHFRWPGVKAVRNELVSGWPTFLSLAVSAISYFTNQFIVGLKEPLSEMAYFSASNRLTSAVRMLVTPVSAAVYPHASQKAATSELEVILFVRKYSLLFAAPFLLASLAMFAGAGYLPLLLGAQYKPSVPVLRIMAFGPLEVALMQMYSTYYMLACGFDKAWMKIMVTCAGANFAFLGLTLHFFRGSIALALTGLAAEGLALFLYWRFYARRARLLLSEANPETVLTA
jgi:PST family polysaccharide transporter